MSVAEKLKALDKMPPFTAITKLSIALPQIVAVVEAADKAREQAELWSEDANDGEFAIWSKDELMGALFALRPALAALDQALTADGKTE